MAYIAPQTLPAMYVAARTRGDGEEWIAAVAAATGRKPAGVRNWLYGYTRPNKDIRRRLSALFGVHEDILFPLRFAKVSYIRHSERLNSEH